VLVVPGVVEVVVPGSVVVVVPGVVEVVVSGIVGGTVVGVVHCLNTLKARSMVTCWVTPFFVALPTIRRTFPPMVMPTTGPTSGSWVICPVGAGVPTQFGPLLEFGFEFPIAKMKWA
jgi:hypothetical protein